MDGLAWTSVSVFSFLVVFFGRTGGKDGSAFYKLLVIGLSRFRVGVLIVVGLGKHALIFCTA